MENYRSPVSPEPRLLEILVETWVSGRERLFFQPFVKFNNDVSC